jgi:hypothetical protein
MLFTTRSSRLKSARLKSEVHAIVLGAALAVPCMGFAAEVTLPPVSVGAGMRTSFTHSEVDAPGSQDVDDFELNSARIYLSGKATENISIMLNTEYNPGAGETIRVIDAAAQFSFSDQVNVWAGRFLPPSDRANLYGPYYANHWGVYTDGIQDGYPFETEGRADGVMYWGQFGIVKVSAGVFDIEGLTKGSSDVLSAARVQVNFWDQEAGYYLNGTYYGDKDLLTLGVAAQNADGQNAYSVDFLFEKNLGGAGVVTAEAEYAKYDGLGGYGSPRTDTTVTPVDPIGYEASSGGYLLGAYILPMDIGIGKLQFLVKVAKNEFDFTQLPGLANTDVDQDTTEININYLIKQFNARISAFYIDTDYSGTVFPGTALSLDGKKYGVGLQVQM